MFLLFFLFCTCSFYIVFLLLPFPWLFSPHFMSVPRVLLCHQRVEVWFLQCKDQLLSWYIFQIFTKINYMTLISQGWANLITATWTLASSQVISKCWTCAYPITPQWPYYFYKHNLQNIIKCCESPQVSVICFHAVFILLTLALIHNMHFYLCCCLLTIVLW